jgi:hypothetical protein
VALPRRPIPVERLRLWLRLPLPLPLQPVLPLLVAIFCGGLPWGKSPFFIFGVVLCRQRARIFATDRRTLQAGVIQMNKYGELPMGFGMALMQNQAAAQYFHSLSEQERRRILEETHQIASKEDMRAFVDHLAQG